MNFKKSILSASCLLFLLSVNSFGQTGECVTTISSGTQSGPAEQCTLTECAMKHRNSTVIAHEPGSPFTITTVWTAINNQETTTIRSEHPVKLQSNTIAEDLIQCITEHRLACLKAQSAGLHGSMDTKCEEEFATLTTITSKI